MTLTDSGRSQYFVDCSRSRRRKCVAVYSLYLGSRVSRVVPDQGAGSRYQGGAVERVCVSISSRMRVRSPEGAGWYDLELLRIYIEEGADSEEEQWVTASETESDTDESDSDESEDGQGD